MKTPSVKPHVVFGAGQVGSGLARALLARGFPVRVVRRSAVPLDGAEVVTGDARNPAFVASVTRDAAVVYHCMNPSAYTRRAWEAEFPALGEALIAGATAAGARLVCLDNLYGYGPIDGVRTEATPMAPTGPKGRVRAAWDARLRAAPGLRWVAGRAGDFFGPGAGEQSLFSETNLAKAKVLVVGDADAPHAFSHVPDVVEALVALGTAADDVEGRVFHLPIVQATPRALAGKPVRVVPAWVIRALSLFVPFFAELRETLYQWERPFLADDGAFRARFPEVGRGLGVVG